MVGCGELCGVALAKKHHNNKGRTWVATWRRASKQCVLRFVCAHLVHIGILNDENWSGRSLLVSQNERATGLYSCTVVLSTCWYSVHTTACMYSCLCLHSDAVACRSYLREFKFKWLGTIAQLAINSVYIVWWCRGVDAIWPHAHQTSAHPLLLPSTPSTEKTIVHNDIHTTFFLARDQS
jgi:hypothetical protein